MEPQHDEPFLLLLSELLPFNVQQATTKKSVPSRGYEVDLVSKTNTFDCPICLNIPNDPMQVTCCGKKFCRSCIDQVLSEKNTCPHCQTKGGTFQVFEDTALKQDILELNVYCPCKKMGCGWTGKLYRLDEHMNLGTCPTSEGCQYVELDCIHCKKHHPRYHMRSCPLQEYTCPCCKHFSASYENITSSHMLECEEFPVPCPACNRLMARKDLHLHKSECPNDQELLHSKHYFSGMAIVG